MKTWKPRKSFWEKVGDKILDGLEDVDLVDHWEKHGHKYVQAVGMFVEARAKKRAAAESAAAEEEDKLCRAVHPKKWLICTLEKHEGVKHCAVEKGNLIAWDEAASDRSDDK